MRAPSVPNIRLKSNASRVDKADEGKSWFGLSIVGGLSRPVDYGEGTGDTTEWRPLLRGGSESVRCRVDGANIFCVGKKARRVQVYVCMHPLCTGEIEA